MKRFALVLVLLLALGGAGAIVATAQAPTGGLPGADASPHAYGYGGKITALKPGYRLSDPPANTSSIFKPLLSLVPPVFGVDVNMGPGNETSIAANPANPLNFIAGSNNTNRFASTDGGTTWSAGTLSSGGDPAVAFDSSGNGYYASLGNTSTCPDNPYVRKTTDGGLTYGAIVFPITDPSPSDHFFDKEWITVDNNSTSPYFGRIYVTASNFHTPAGCNLNAYIDVREQLTFSTDQGATFSTSTNINDAPHDQDQFTNPVAARDGTLYVGYQYQNCTFNCTSSLPMSNLIAKSTNGGVSFSPSITITGQPISITGAFVGGYEYLYAGSTSSGFRHNDQAIIGVSPTNANQVYAVWTDGRWDTSFVYQSVTGLHADIAFSRSTNGGTTWTAPVRLNDDAMGNGKDQFFPWMTVGTDGTIHASWMDRRDSTTGFQYGEYYTQSTDGGLTWSANQMVADAMGTPGSFIGDYSGIAVNYNNTLVLPIWTDMRSGQRTYTDRGVMVPGITATPTITPVASTPTNTPAVNTPTATPCVMTFTDVLPTDYFYAGVRYLYCKGAVSGYGTVFLPYNNTTRGQLTKIVVLGYGFTLYTPPTPTFRDVDTTNAFYTYIETAYHLGFISGYSCGTGCLEFRPVANVTRAQLCKIVVNAAGWTPINPPTATFRDVPTTDTFYQYVETAYCHLIITGYNCGTGCLEFRPNASATRGQIAKIVYEAILNHPCAPSKP